MPLETFNGMRIPPLLAQAQRDIGEDAIVLSVRRITSDRYSGFELLAADPDTAHDFRAPNKPLAQPALDPMAWPSSRRLPSSDKPIIVALVGPTGSGKTTTIAKLANHPEAFGNIDVGLISLDTYRVGALEQSRIYAELSRIPIEVVYEMRDIQIALQRLRGCKVLLVDTAGRGPSMQSDAAITQAQLSALDPYEVHLTLPTGLQPQWAHQIIEEYSPYGVTHVIPTKVDECPGDDTPFQVAAEHSLPMLWLANGQEVPNDLSSVLVSSPAYSSENSSVHDELALETV